MEECLQEQVSGILSGFISVLNLVYPSINVEMQEGLANAFKEGGFLPEWSSPGFADVMIGNNSRFRSCRCLHKRT